LTVYGFDIASHQAGLDVTKVAPQGFDFVVVKLTEGVGYTNPYFEAWRAQAQSAGLLFAAYHALHHGNGAAQADYFCSKLADKSIPAMVDFEPFGDNPTAVDAKAFVKQCAAHGVTVTLNYHPHWYWQSIGSPSLRRLPAVISSAYPHNTAAYAAAGYKAAGGDSGAGWAKYGGRKPIIWQYTSVGRVDGWSGNVDFDAYKGTRDELAATGLFKDYGHKKPAPQPKGHPNLDEARARLRKAAKAYKGGPIGRAVRAALKALRLVK
jgi:hypothetical protein